MDLQEWIDYANRQCAQGASWLSYGSDVWTRDLSREEADILAAAAESGEVRLGLKAGNSYPELQSRGAPIFEEVGEFARMREWDAFVSLCLRGVIEPRTPGLYAVSEAAVIKGRRIAAQRLGAVIG